MLRGNEKEIKLSVSANHFDISPHCIDSYPATRGCYSEEQIKRRGSK